MQHPTEFSRLTFPRGATRWTRVLVWSVAVASCLVVNTALVVGAVQLWTEVLAPRLSFPAPVFLVCLAVVIPYISARARELRSRVQQSQVQDVVGATASP